MFGASRTSVREAVQILYAHGLVSIEKGKCIFVKKISSGSVRNNILKFLEHWFEGDYYFDLIHARQIIESGIAYLAALNRTDENLKELEKDINDISNKEHQYDLPFYYKGHFLSANFEYQAYTTSKTIMGAKNGYQHLWKEAYGKPGGQHKFTWLNNERFYTITSNTNENTEVYFTRIGASDPNFNLRNETRMFLRENTKSRCFTTVIEPHGSFDPILEKPVVLIVKLMK